MFDTETTTDAAQQLRFGTYRLYKGPDLYEAGLFYDAETVGEDGVATIARYGGSHNMKVLSVEEFVDTVFFEKVYLNQGLLVGFNLPFDLSRLAIDHAPARRSMRGGFSFRLTKNPTRPRLQVHHLNSREALIQFAGAATQRTPRGQRRRHIRVRHRRGFFVDVRSLAGAIEGGSWSLHRLGEHLCIEHPKLGTDEHGGDLTEEYLDYAVRDPLATWECFVFLRDRYQAWGLTETPITRVYSEASIGKAYLRQMGVLPWRKAQPEVSPELTELTGIIMTTYYGGRSEVHLRRTVGRVLYCDFLSMYPTVCTLMGLWQYVIGQGVAYCDTTDATRRFLHEVSLAMLQQPDAWQRLATLVKVAPDADVFPVRARYPDGNGTTTIGVNTVTSEVPIWFTLADVIASKLLTGKAPTVLEAVTFTHGPVQDGLRSVAIAGNRNYRVIPKDHDFYRRLIDLRAEVKKRKTVAERAGRIDEAARLDAEQLAIKITANATSYGIFVELNVEEGGDLEEVACYGADGPGFSARVKNLERPGLYFHPLLATLITGAARLMLAMAERLIIDQGLDWAFCDTDSMAILRPDGMDEAEFLKRADRVRTWFDALNPYQANDPVFKLEDANYHVGPADIRSDQIEPLYVHAVSAKRYALFNLDPKGRPVIRKASAHGLGHLLPPYGNDHATPGIPAPKVKPGDSGVERWQHDVWYQIASVAASDTQARLRLHGDTWRTPAVSRYAATTPTTLRWFDDYNQGRFYRDQVRPFGFLLAFQSPARPVIAHTDDNLGPAKTAWAELRHRILDEGGVCPTVEHAPRTVPRAVLRRAGKTPGQLAPVFGKASADEFMGWVRETAEAAKQRTKRLGTPLRPVAPYDRDITQAAAHTFDRDTGAPVPRENLTTYRHALAQYHLHPEDKFLNGDFTDRGPTARRHVVVQAVEYIGKEANHWEEQFYLGEDELAQVEYGTDPASLDRMRGTALRTVQTFGQRRVAKTTGLSLRDVGALLRDGRATPGTLGKICRAVEQIRKEDEQQKRHTEDVLARAKARAQTIGVRRLAKEAGVDPANLAKVVSGKRRMGRTMFNALAACVSFPDSAERSIW